ncbi:MAG: AIR synthase related protein, partial [Bacillota bacterium]
MTHQNAAKSAAATMPSYRIDQSKHIVMAHGGGGQLTDELIAHTLLPRLANQTLNELLDASAVPSTAGRMAMTIDGYVVRPLSFPGGDIGRLAVSGTVNDLSVCGAEPLGLALSLILAEGLERTVLEAMLDSIRSTADEAGVQVITGDTKVVGRGQADGMYITSAGVGSVPPNRRLHPDQIRPGDLVMVT